MIDFEPSDEQALIIETVRQFAENEIRPLCREADERGAPSPDVLAAAHELNRINNRPVEPLVRSRESGAGYQ